MLTMLPFLFGGTIFPNQTILESKFIYHRIWEWILQKMNSCYNCNWTNIMLLFISVIILMLGIVYVQSRK